MKTYQVEELERSEIKLVGYSIMESLNNMLESKVGGQTRERLAERKAEVAHRTGDGMYLIQEYCQVGEWTPDTPYRHVFAYEVDAIDRVPDGLMTYTLPPGRYIKIVHEGAESRIGETYDFINQTYGGRPIDIEYWDDIRRLEEEDGRIEIFIPAGNR